MRETKQQNAEDLKRLALLACYKLSVYLKERVESACFHSYSHLLSYEVSAEDLRFLQEKVYSSLKQREYLKKFFLLLKENEIVKTSLELAILYAIDGQTEDLLKLIHNRNIQGITLEAAAKLTYPENEMLDSFILREIDKAYPIVSRLFYFNSDNVIYAPFFADYGLMHLFSGCGTSVISNKNLTFWSLENSLAPSFLFQKEIDAVAERIEKLSNKKLPCPFVLITGDEQSGRKFTAKQIAKKEGCSLFFLSYEVFYGAETEERERLLFEINRELSLTNHSICITDIEIEKKSEKQQVVVLLIHRLAESEKFILFTAKAGKKLMPYTENPVISLELPKPDIEQHIQLWREFSRLYHVPVDAQILGQMFRLKAGQIQRVIKAFSEEYQESVTDNVRIFQLCDDVLDTGGWEFVNKTETFFTWEDIKLEQETKESLEDICSHVFYRGKVLEQWGLKECYPYGNGVSALFTGPPGTGKTMAAQVIANRLHLDLYKIELSQVIDKYIGETEKHLETIFQWAEQNHFILFFDEADAVFGKRTEIRESKDRHANIEVAYLLQKIEQYDGIILLATNFKNNLDPAFLRRIRYEVHFSMPSEEVRREIWESLFLPRVPAEAIDFSYLAAQFEFTGATIKNVFLNAAFRAASLGNEAITMKEILYGIKSEYKKMEKIISLVDFGKYAYLIQ